jgi:tetratricopeptide (TPR) repeat protein
MRTASNGTAVCVKVRLNDSQATLKQVKVVLEGSDMLARFETYTNDEGDAYLSGIVEGAYHLVVSGPSIEETSQYLRINRGEKFQSVVVTVKRAGGTAQSTAPSVSLATLNLPEKARREFEAGIKSLLDSRLDDADKHFSKAVRQYPAYAAAWNALGIVQMRLERFNEAQNSFEKALLADQGCFEACVNLGKTLIKEEKYADAETSLNKCLGVSPRDPDALIVLASLHLTMGKLAEAVSNAQTVYTLPGANVPAARLIAAIALQRQGLYPEALGEYKQFLEESPNSSSADKIRAQIAALEKLVH